MKKLFSVVAMATILLTSAFSQQIGTGTGYEATQEQFGAHMKSGMYKGSTVQEGYPDVTNVYKHLIVSSGASSNNHQFQISSTYSTNDRMFFRKITSTGTGISNTKWHEVATRGANTFTGNQVVNGTQTINGAVTVNGSLKVADANFTISDNRMFQIGSQRSRIFGHSGGNWFDYNNALHIRQWSAGKTIMSFTSTGNVGIGITNPSKKFEVNGTIRAKKVLVEANNWPDYVFDSDYSLRSLEEVADHIENHKHLPDLPSATEVEENGLDMGTMQNLMLKKIEELTLYTIEQQKLIKELQNEVEALKLK